MFACFWIIGVAISKCEMFYLRKFPFECVGCESRLAPRALVRWASADAPRLGAWGWRRRITRTKQTVLCLRAAARRGDEEHCVVTP